MYEEAFFPNLETLVYVLPQLMHEAINTDFSGELEQSLFSSSTVHHHLTMEPLPTDCIGNRKLSLCCLI